ncbi:MAG: hypothetical protein A2X02_04495 [Bacteroidetes bacterium GWF2_29_10]|nr:MAG: hypothetical protein A2X02_04495 [Bacteroidetes bacterium GWF2_29_10]
MLRVLNSKVLTIIVLITMLSACGGSSNKKAELAKLKKQESELQDKIKQLELELEKKFPENKRVVGVQTILIEQQLFEHYIEVQGKVDGDENVIVSPRAAGNIIKINVKEGDMVKKGQVLAEIDADVLIQSIKELKVSLDYVTELYNKQKSLWEQKIGSEVQYLGAKNNKESLEYKLKTLNEQLEMYKITSPIDGSVEESPLKIGQSVAPGMLAFRVVNFSTIKVVADVAENYGGLIKKDNDVIISFPDMNKEVLSKISFKSRYINPVNRTFKIEIKLKSEDADFFANMITILKIKDYEADSAIVLPINVVQKDAEGSFVYIANNNKTEKRYLGLGKTYNNGVEILKGISVGEKVISVGIQNVEEGQEIIEQ